MEEIDIKKLVKIAKEINSRGKKWHFHMLTPGCIFNERKDKDAFVLENETDQKVYIVYSDERYMDIGEELVKLVHGDNIVRKDDSDENIDNKIIKKILERAKELNQKNIKWHHHMLFPDCIFNKHQGKYCIVFEDPENKNVLEFVSKKEPLNELRMIEILYYQQKK